jgi:hypothetical protein
VMWPSVKCKWSLLKCMKSAQNMANAIQHSLKDFRLKKPQAQYTAIILHTHISCAIGFIVTCHNCGNFC